MPGPREPAEDDADVGSARHLAVVAERPAPDLAGRERLRPRRLEPRREMDRGVARIVVARTLEERQGELVRDRERLARRVLERRRHRPRPVLLEIDRDDAEQPSACRRSRSSRPEP
jgi:hypothetical protein